MTNYKFESIEQKNEFLLIYDMLQPYLVEVDYHYDKKWYLRGLEKPENFKKAVKQITDPKELAKLEVLFNAKTNAIKQKVKLYDEHISVLKEQQKEYAPEINRVRKERLKKMALAKEIDARVSKLISLALVNTNYGYSIAKEIKQQFHDGVNLDVIGADKNLTKSIQVACDEIDINVDNDLLKKIEAIVEFKNKITLMKNRLPEALPFKDVQVQYLSEIDAQLNSVLAQDLSSKNNDQIDEVEKSIGFHEKILESIDITVDILKFLHEHPKSSAETSSEEDEEAEVQNKNLGKIISKIENHFSVNKIGDIKALPQKIDSFKSDFEKSISKFKASGLSKFAHGICSKLFGTKKANQWFKDVAAEQTINKYMNLIDEKTDGRHSHNKTVSDDQLTKPKGPAAGR